jgi:hypothetical protein
VSTDRIIWNRRPDSSGRMGDIDEIVVRDCVVHVEQMSDRAWWICISRSDGTYWMGNFTADTTGHMRFDEQENAGVVWGTDHCHTDETVRANDHAELDADGA